MENKHAKGILCVSIRVWSILLLGHLYYFRKSIRCRQPNLELSIFVKNWLNIAGIPVKCLTWKLTNWISNLQLWSNHEQISRKSQSYSSVSIGNTWPNRMLLKTGRITKCNIVFLFICVHVCWSFRLLQLLSFYEWNGVFIQPTPKPFYRMITKFNARTRGFKPRPCC